MLLLVDVRNGQVTVFRRQHSTFRKPFYENWAPLQRCGPSLEYCVRIWRKLIRKWPRNTPNRPSNTPNYTRLESSAAYTISEEGIRFRHPDYDPNRAQKLISSTMSQHLSTRNISSKPIHAFLSNLAYRQTDKQARACVHIHDGK